MIRIVCFVCFVLSITCSAMADTKEPMVYYHTSPSWNGYPSDRSVSGWNVVLFGNDTRGANTGILSFLMRWDAKKQCWGVQRDCRSPRWALSQRLLYVGPVSAANLSVEVRQ